MPHTQGTVRSHGTATATNGQIARDSKEDDAARPDRTGQHAGRCRTRRHNADSLPELFSRRERHDADSLPELFSRRERSDRTGQQVGRCRTARERSDRTGQQAGRCRTRRHNADSLPEL
eukprot:Polyplicarium_translucidae@DN2088_c0_g1_i2.p1